METMDEVEQGLSEEKFIDDSKRKKSPSFLKWVILLCVLMMVFLAGNWWYSSQMSAFFERGPFLQVTNRQMSLFLWQNPEFMRVNSPQKASYLPAFNYTNKLTMDIAQADHYVVAPPDLLFRYHTWHRLVSDEFSQRPIAVQEFVDFLSYAEEWHPDYWIGAPVGYRDMVHGLPNSQLANLATLSLVILPMEVRIAFQGWRNYFKDKEAINQVQPTFKQMKQFIADNPHYARNFWRNLVMNSTPGYIVNLKHPGNDDLLVPKNELNGFLKLAFYNYTMAQKGE